jgi:hypothetical protein
MAALLFGNQENIMEISFKKKSQGLFVGQYNATPLREFRIVVLYAKEVRE